MTTKQDRFTDQKTGDSYPPRQPASQPQGEGYSRQECETLANMIKAQGDEATSKSFGTKAYWRARAQKAEQERDQARAQVADLLAALRGMIDMATDSRCHGKEIDAAVAAMARRNSPALSSLSL